MGVHFRKCLFLSTIDLEMPSSVEFFRRFPHRSPWTFRYLLGFHPLQNDKIVALSKLKAFADDKFYVIQSIRSVFHEVKNIEGKEENGCLPAFSSFPKMFSKDITVRYQWSSSCLMRVNAFHSNKNKKRTSVFV